MKTFLRSLACSTALALAPAAFASYVSHPAAQEFIDHMVAEHQLNADELRSLFARTERVERALELIRPPERTGPVTRSWENYRARFLGNAHISGGLDFWRANQSTLEAASRRYGVPPEYIVAIIGVETNYGRVTGNFQTLPTLATLAFDYPPRADLFRRELENLLLLAHEQQRDPFSYYGSYAGALGYPQFLPSSVRHYAVDFDGNGRIDFESNPVDAIGSVANYFAVHGWQPGKPVAVHVALPPRVDPAPLIEAGIEPSLDAAELARQGVTPFGGELHAGLVTMYDLPTPGADTQYWLGYRNFYVITRYNRSSFYAQAVFELAQTLRHHHDRAGR